MIDNIDHTNNNCIVITPVKNEQEYISETINSIINQTIMPKKWIIIDDNSTDLTMDIVVELTNNYDWIEVIRAGNIVEKEISSRIAMLYCNVVNSINIKDYDFLVKIDGDVTFKKDFFEKIINEFHLNPKLGIASGVAVYKAKIESNDEKSLTRGSTKFYRRSCWEDIGGIFKSRGWDSIDNYMAMKNGWHIKKCNHPFTHLKEEGKYSGLILVHYWTGLYNGRVPYFFPFFILKIIRHSINKPIILGSFIQLIGYMVARWVTKQRPFPDDLALYMQKIQKERLKNILI